MKKNIPNNCTFIYHSFDLRTGPTTFKGYQYRYSECFSNGLPASWESTDIYCNGGFFRNRVVENGRNISGNANSKRHKPGTN